MRETTIEKLTIGVQNPVIDSIRNKSTGLIEGNSEKFLETIVVSNDAFSVNNSRNVSYSISNLIGNCCKNFKINRKYLDLIESIELSIDVQKIDKVYTQDFEVLYKNFKINTESDDMYTSIPINTLFTLFLPKFHEVRLTFIMNDNKPDNWDNDQLLKYDAYNCNTYNSDICKEVIIRQVVVNELILSHPVTRIIIKTDSKEKLNLEVDGILKLSIEGESYKNYMIFNMNEINFSRIQKSRFLHPDISVRMIAVNLNVLRFASGMAGLAYSN